MTAWVRAAANRYVKRTTLAGRPITFCATPVDPRRPDISYWEAYATVDGQSQLVVRDVDCPHVTDACDRAVGELT